MAKGLRKNTCTYLALLLVQEDLASQADHSCQGHLSLQVGLLNQHQVHQHHLVFQVGQRGQVDHPVQEVLSLPRQNENTVKFLKKRTKERSPRKWKEGNMYMLKYNGTVITCTILLIYIQHAKVGVTLFIDLLIKSSTTHTLDLDLHLFHFINSNNVSMQWCSCQLDYFEITIQCIAIH